MMKRKLINIFICCASTICSNAQVEGYKYYASLDTIKTAGFYNIVLSPDINAHLKTDYSDVRIVNAAGKWVPHEIHVPAFKINTDVVNAELQYALKQNNKSKTIIIINAQTLSLNDIKLSIRNTTAERYCSLSGSDDNANWFVINDSILINPTASDTKNLNYFSLNFPLSNYKYYKIVIVNINKDPFDINGISTSVVPYQPTITKSEIIKNPIPTFVQKDSGKCSYIKIKQNHPYHFDGLNLKVSGVKYFVRNVELYIPASANHSFSNLGKLVQTFSVSNNSSLTFRLPLINDSVFYITIQNDDNIPLKVTEINTTINEHLLKTYLEAGDKYRIIVGNDNAIQPVYDITKLGLSFRDTATFLNVKKLTPFVINEKVELKKGENNKWIIWVALIAGLFILLLLTKKMIKEVYKKTTNDTV